MAILFEVGEVVAAPPTGKAILRLNSAGAAVTVAHDGTETEITSASPAQAAKLAVYDYDGWMQTAVAEMKLAAPALSAGNFRELKIGDGSALPIAFGATAASIDGATAGGSIANAASSTAKFTAGSIVQAPKTASWAVAFQARILVTTGSDFNLAGLLNAAGTHDIGVAAYHAGDATDKYLLYTFDGQEVIDVSTVAADTAWHRFTIGFDFPNLTLNMYIDGALECQITDLTGITAEPFFAGMAGTAASAVKCSRFAYGYLAP